MKQHRPLVHALSRTIKRLSTGHQVDGGAPFNTTRDLRMDMVIERGGVPDTALLAFPNKAIFRNFTHEGTVHHTLTSYHQIIIHRYRNYGSRLGLDHPHKTSIFGVLLKVKARAGFQMVVSQTRSVLQIMRLWFNHSILPDNCP